MSGAESADKILEIIWKFITELSFEVAPIVDRRAFRCGMDLCKI